MKVTKENYPCIAVMYFAFYFFIRIDACKVSERCFG